MQTAPHWRQALTRDEIEELLEIHDLRAWLSIAIDWGIVAAAMAAVALWPNLGTVLLALFLIGGRQLGFAILMHDAAHQILFRDRRRNDWAGNWLCAYPIWADLHPYRPYHLQHHAKNWTRDDPDLDLATKHPVSRRSMIRKIWRDLSGQVAWKRVRAILDRERGRSRGKMARAAGRRRGPSAQAVAFGNTDSTRSLSKATRGMLLTNAILFGVLALLGHPLLYLLWVGAWFTTYSFVTRLRSIAEHGMIDDPTDELRNTRTTLAGPLARLFLAPNRVNYHLEHHLLMTVPHYHLPRMHRLLRERGALDGACVERSYGRVLERASRGPREQAA
jgi:fatty acid desaturase